MTLDVSTTQEEVIFRVKGEETKMTRGASHYIITSNFTGHPYVEDLVFTNLFDVFHADIIILDFAICNYQALSSVISSLFFLSLQPQVLFS